MHEHEHEHEHGSDPDHDPRPLEERIERRQMPRRADDVEIAWASWARALVLHRGKIIGAVAALCTFMGGLISTAGWRAYGPPQELSAFRAEARAADSGIVKRVSRLEEGGAERQERIRKLEEQDEFKMYLLCVIVRRTDPEATPPKCGSVIGNGQRGALPTYQR